jgi:dTDP-4-dehydrorhamnose reductase
MEFKRVLITGSGGMLGNAIAPYFKQRCAEVLATDIQIEADERDWLTYLDARDAGAMRRTFTEFKPDLVLHLAALVDLEFCEVHPKDPELTNQTATGIVARLAAEHGATLVYISTGGVFDGVKEGYYTEADQPNPIMVYGATKFAGEGEVRAAAGRHYVVRSGLDGGWRASQRPQVRLSDTRSTCRRRAHPARRRRQVGDADLHARFRDESVRAARS